VTFRLLRSTRVAIACPHPGAAAVAGHGRCAGCGPAPCRGCTAPGTGSPLTAAGVGRRATRGAGWPRSAPGSTARPGAAGRTPSAPHSQRAAVAGAAGRAGAAAAPVHPARVVLRPSSQLTVDGAAPKQAPRWPAPSCPDRARRAMTARSSSDRNPGDSTTTGLVANGECRGRDAAPEPPPCPRPPVDTHRPARLGVAHPLRDQPREPRRLLRQRLRPAFTTSARDACCDGRCNPPRHGGDDQTYTARTGIADTCGISATRTCGRRRRHRPRKHADHSPKIRRRAETWIFTDVQEYRWRTGPRR